MQKKYTGGTVLHLYMNERISSPDACKKLVRRALERFGLPYITITPTFSICPKHGYIEGEHPLLSEVRRRAAREKAKRAGACMKLAIASGHRVCISDMESSNELR